MENRTQEEELEYRRYLRKRIRMRKRRRKVMITRTVLALLALVVIFLVFYGIGRLTGPIGGSKVADNAQEPTSTPFVVDIPEGYEKIYTKLFAMRSDYPEVDDILLNLAQYPKDVLRLVINNTETLDFVSNYLKHTADETVSGTITTKEASSGIPQFQQWDQRWGYVRYSDNILAINGCGPTCLSMVYTGLTQRTDMTPADIADLSVENNYYTEDSGTSWSLMTEGAQKLGLQVEKISVTKEAIQERLQAGQPVICSMMPGDFTKTGHFIVLQGLSESGKLLVNDPNSIARSNKEWKIKKVVKQVKAAWAYAYTG